MSATNTNVGDTVVQSLPTGAVVGVGSYILSYVLLFVFLILEGGNMLQQQAWKAAGLILYNAHNVDIVASAMGQTQSVNILAQAGGTTSIPTIVYYVVPVLVLVVMGYVVASMANLGSNVAAAAAAGATVTVGYLVLAVLGTFVFTVGSAMASGSPDLMMSVVLMGLVYPIVFGSIGGAIAGATN